MIDKINRAIELSQEFSDTNFTRCDQESVEILLMLAYGHIFDIFTRSPFCNITVQASFLVSFSPLFSTLPHRMYGISGLFVLLYCLLDTR